MPASITINNYLNKISNTSNESLKDLNKGDMFSSVLQGASSPEKAAKNGLYDSSKISNINESEIKDIYHKIRIEAKDELDKAGNQAEGLTIVDYINQAIDNIMDYPLDVKIERSEINTAIIYNRLGNNYLDIKRIEVRVSLLELARDEIEENKSSMNKEKLQQISEKIDNNLSELANRKQSILDDSQAKNQGQRFLENLLFSK